jgi:putative two-component system response regulator
MKNSMGGGYPEGLTGDEIPIGAQLVSLADVYDALISKRCYKPSFSYDTAYQMILDGECGIFNPRLLQCFIKKKNELEAMAEQFKD